MKRVLIGWTLLIASVMSQAQTPTESVEQFLRQVATTESDKAFDQMFTGSGIFESKPQDMLMLKSQTKMAMGIYGTPIGFEKVREEDFSPSLKRLVYIQKFETYPVAWEFYFYKAKDKWVINSLNFKDQIASIVGSRQ